MIVVKEILNVFFALLFTWQVISCRPKQTPTKEDDMSNMPGMSAGTKSKNQDTLQHSFTTISINDVIRPTDKFVLTRLPLTTIQEQTNKVDLEFYGIVNYNEKGAEVISSRVAGRIDKLYLKYRFENIHKGQNVMAVYSPELETIQEDLLFLLRNDPENISLIESAKQKLLLFGLSKGQLDELIETKNVKSTFVVQSAYSGHIHESVDNAAMNNTKLTMNEFSQTTEPLSLKEGMYVTKGQSLFVIYNPANAWISANAFPEQQPFIHKGDAIQIHSGSDSSEVFMGKIDFIEPQYREGNKSLTVRIDFNNSLLKLPIGSRVKVVLKGINISGAWLPASSILSLGREKVVFVKSGGGFIARKINLQLSVNGKSKISGDLLPKDSVVLNAQYLVDSESFIKVNQ